MDKLEIGWRFLIAGVAVWRLSQLLFGESEAKDTRRSGEDGKELTGVRFWSNRVLDLLCWISVSLSSQTALWVACGFTGVFCSWLAISGVSRLFGRVTGEANELSGTPGHAQTACVSCGDGMQADHG